MDDDFGTMLRRGARGVVLAQVAAQVVTLVVLAVLYRQLGPAPFGLVGMVLPVLLLVRIVLSGGLDIATIQQAELAPAQVSGLFWLNQLLGLAMTAATAAAAPLLAWFYEEPTLLPLTLALAGTALAAAVGMQHQALLQRQMRLGTLAGARLAAQTVAGAAAIATAAAGGGVWALVVQQYVEWAVLAGLAWGLEPWRPGRPARAEVRSLVRFGGHYTASALMFYLTANADKVLVGYALGPVALGIYGQAFNLMMRPVHVVMTPLLSVMLPALARAWPDRARYTELLLAFYRAIALAMLPAGVGLVLVADEAMRVLGGPQWAGAGPVLAILAAVLPVQALFNALGSVLAAAGRADRLAAAAAVMAVVLCGAFVLGLVLGRATGEPLWGVAAGYTIGLAVIVFPPYLRFALGTVGVPLAAWWREVRPAARASAAMGLVVGGAKLALSPLPALPAAAELAVLVALGGASYGWLVRREVGTLLKGRSG